TNANTSRDQVVHELQPLRLKLDVEVRHAGDVAARLIEASYKSVLHRIIAVGKDNRDSCGSRPGGQGCRGTHSSNDHYPVPYQISYQCLEAVVSTLSPVVFDHDVVPLNVARFAQAFAEYTQTVWQGIGHRTVEKPDDWHQLLRARCKRVSHPRAAKQRHDF